MITGTYTIKQMAVMEVHAIRNIIRILGLNRMVRTIDKQKMRWKISEVFNEELVTY